MVELGVEPRTGGEVLSAGIAALRDRLPPTWSLSVAPDQETSDGRPDAVVTVQASDGREVILVIKVKRLPEGRDVDAMRNQLASDIARQPGSVGVVVAQYLSQAMRERLAEAGLSYVDATGNVLVQAESPAFFISDRGAQNNPWRGSGRPRGNLKGEPAAKVVRALLDVPGPWGIRALVDASGTSTGSVYRVVEFLETEGLVVRERRALISIPDWRALLRRWSEDYEFLHTNTGSPDGSRRVVCPPFSSGFETPTSTATH